MQRIFAQPRITLASHVSTLFQDIRQARRIAKETHDLKSLPRDRLDDMGIASDTQANRRHSGQTGSVPRPIHW
tara:strand:- start:106 stop:324 length:219 start_codon:yes stop_codon:yes gene_type:complete